VIESTADLDLTFPILVIFNYIASYNSINMEEIYSNILSET